MADEGTVVLDWRLCHYIRMPFWVSFGQARVTEAAFIWSPQYAAGLLGRLFKGAGITIPRQDMEVAERGTFGLNKNILSIRTKAGRRYRFQVDEVDAWLKALAPSRKRASQERPEAET